VLLVTEGNPFLERAVKALGVEAVEVVRPERYEQGIPAGHEVVVFDRYRPQKPLGIIASIYFGVVPGGSKLDVAGPDGAPQRTADLVVREWNREHPLLRDLNVEKLFVKQGLKLAAGNGWDVLLNGTGGPLAVASQRRDERGGTVVVCFDPSNSNWPVMVSFPRFLHRAVHWAVGAEVDGGKERAAVKRYFQQMEAHSGAKGSKERVALTRYLQQMEALRGAKH
jgi:hypothetical protein